jgi:FkbM family methyltransferase
MPDRAHQSPPVARAVVVATVPAAYTPVNDEVPVNVPEGMKQGRLRLSRYVATLGRLRGGSLFLREALGDRSRITVRYRGRRLVLRLGTSDILVLFGVFEREDYAVDLAVAPTTIVDAGAYTGFSSIYFATRYPGARVLALEPDPTNFEALVENTRPYPNIIPLNEALWHEECALGLYDSGTGHWGFFVEQEAPPGVPRLGQVNATSMPALIKRYAIGGIDILKLNVEGSEREILGHCGEWIGRVGAILAARLHDDLKPGCSEAFERVVASFGEVKRDRIILCAIRDLPVPPSAEPL